MPRDARKYLFDIGEASKLISQFVAGKTLDDYLSDALLQSGVERQFEKALQGSSGAELLRLRNGKRFDGMQLPKSIKAPHVARRCH